jgi:hypothetical protein
MNPIPVVGIWFGFHQPIRWFSRYRNGVFVFIGRSERAAILRNNLLLLLVGFFAGLWFSERGKNKDMRELVQSVVKQPAASPPTRKERTLEEISPTYAANPHPLKSIYAINPDALSDYVREIMKEFIRPDLTPLEAKLVADYLHINMMRATSHDEHHKGYAEQRSKEWLQDIINETKAQLTEWEESPDADDTLLD